MILRLRRKAHVPQRAFVEEVVLHENWRAALTPHMAATGCLALCSDFVDRQGMCPRGGRYDEHL